MPPATARSALAAACLAFLALSLPLRAQPSRPEELEETYGERFCEVTFRTSAPCETRVLLFDGQHESALRSARQEPSTQHRLLLPLGRDRELGYSILLPDGSRSEPRRLKPAAKTPMEIRLLRSAAGDGTPEWIASTSLDARWTLRLPGRPEMLMPPGDRTASSARFGLGRLAPDAILEGATIVARGLDASCELRADPLLGNRQLARRAVECLRRMDIVALLAIAADPRMTRAALVEAFHRQASQSGLERLLPEAAARAVDIAADPQVDASLSIGLTYLLCRLGDVDWAARLRGWEPVTGTESSALALGRASPERRPGPDSVKIFEQEAGRMAALSTYPPGLGGGIESCSFSFLNDPQKLEGLIQEAQDELPNAAILFAALVQVQLALWSEMDVPARLLDSPDGTVTVHVEVALPDPAWVLYARLNDRAIVALRLTPEDYRASVARQPRDAAPTDPRHLNYMWASCPTSARLLRPGKNNCVVVVGMASPKAATALMCVVRQARLSRGTAPPAR